MNKKRLIALFFCVLLSLVSRSQSPNETWFDYQLNANGEGQIFKLQDGFLAFSGLVNIESLDKGVLITKVDMESNLIWQKTILIPGQSLAMGINSVISANDGYYLALSKFISLEESYPVLIKLNQDGDTVWTKELLVDELGRFFNYVVCLKNNDNLLLCGLADLDVSDDSNPTKLNIIETDSQGNLLSSQVINNGTSLMAESVIATESSVYIGGLVWESNDQAYGISKQFIRKFDLDGNSIWYKKIHVPPAGAEAPAMALIEREDGNIVYAGGRSLGVLPGTGEENNPYTAPCAGVINAATGNVIFENTYNENARYQQFYNLKKLSTGGYIGVGTHRYVSTGELAGNPIGFMVKLDEDLNQIWYRYYVPSVWEGFSRWNNLTDVVENDNGTFTAIGLIYTYTGDGPQGPGDGGFIQDTYLITVDQEGCIIPDCYLGFTEVDQLEEFSVYPNPANNQVNIRWNKVENTEVIVHNSTGQIVLKKSVNQQNQVGLDVSMLPAGVYTVRCIIGGGVSSKVFVKE